MRQDKQKPYSLRLADELKQWVQKKARNNDRSINAEINRIVRKAKEQDTQHG